MQYSVQIPSGFQPRVNQALFNCGDMTKIHTNVSLSGKRFIIVHAVDMEVVQKVFKDLMLPLAYFPYN
jgi:hypothetical protein